MQRFFDIIFSASALFFLFPVFLTTIIILKFTGEGEIFFKQNRVGKDGDIFGLFKFATMLKNSPNIGTGTVTTNNDPRILPLGKFLRATKINELPQLINIINGDMSLVGPRPLTEEVFSNYNKNIQDIILSVRPGLSGIGSIIFRNEENILNDDSLDYYNNVLLPYKGILEKWYVKKKNLYIYFSVIILTISIVIFPKFNIIRKIFPDLPKIPSELEDKLN